MIQSKRSGLYLPRELVIGEAPRERSVWLCAEPHPVFQNEYCIDFFNHSGDHRDKWRGGWHNNRQGAYDDNE